jgi:N-acetylmuramoyl-L-alanine amidase
MTIGFVSTSGATGSGRNRPRLGLIWTGLILSALAMSQCAHPPPVTPPSVEPQIQPPAETKEDGPYNILSYSVDARRNGILIEVLLREPLHYEWFLTGGEWINLTFDHGRLDPQQMQASRPHPDVIEVTAHQFDSSAQLSFRMSSPVEKYIVTTDPYSPKRILVMVTGSSQGEYRGGGQYTSPVDAPWVVVLDPGHGGRDAGAVGRTKKTIEKTVTFLIAERAAKLFERNPKFRVYVTRSGDENVPAEARARIAREARANVFVSIHANFSRKASTHGCKAYYCGKTAAKRAIASTGASVATVEVSAVDSNASAENAEQTTAADRSSMALARQIMDKIASSIQSPVLGTERRDSPFLANACQTSVRLAAGFMSNPTDEALLRKKSYQARIAEAIYLGVVAYRDRHERRDLSSTVE